MRRRHQRAGWIVAALTALLTASFAGATDLVLCLGSDGHRALEVEHAGTLCPTLASSASDAARISAAPAGQALATCQDLPAVGTTPTVLSSSDTDRLAQPPVAILAQSPSPQPVLIARPAGPFAMRTGLAPLARHLRSTVLLI